ncbi:MAG TPA: SusC/RagA family TonB-linked outer membrane protein [Puia sp.]|jgi:iron complex outermembrane receptor protein|nr:SusC/RagA family TonB-linked outer membrane protein [Puia sp.]
MHLTRTTQLLIATTLLSLLHLPGLAQGQTLPVNGTVLSDKGTPVEGASISITASGRGTITNSKGAFTLAAPPNAILVISYVGYDTVHVMAQRTVNVSMRPTAGSLTEVIVIPYGTQQRKDLTGSLAVVTEKDFQGGEITTPEQLIAGKVAGVSITSNGGSPGSGSVIRIRGVVSLSASNDPLIVVDGLPFSGNGIPGASNALSLVNPNDIASFTVLKDAAATAIYGSRASNGVILITTKKGRPGPTRFSFSSQVSAGKLIKEENVMSAAQFRQFVDSTSLGTYNGQPFSALLGSANTDWQRQIFQTAISTDNNLNATGSIGSIPYRASFGYLNQDGIVRTDNLQRYSGSISLTPHFFNDALKVELNLHGAVLQSQFANSGAAISSALYFDPTQPVREKSDYGNFFEWTTGSGSTLTLNKLAPRNPVALLDLYNNHATVQRSFGNLALDYALPWISGLHANLNLGYDVAHGNGIVQVPAYAAQNFLDSGQNNVYKGTMTDVVSEFYLSYLKDLRPIRSTINIVAGYGYYDNKTTNWNYPDRRANSDTIPGSTPLYPTSPAENTMISWYGRLIYTFDNKYILSGSIRTDGSSRFAPANRWGTFPAVALTWRIQQEKFLRSASVLSNLNLRLSYGITGNQDGIADYSYMPVYGLSLNGSEFQFGNTWYNMATASAYDANIKWEQTATWNGGLDYGFLNNRIFGSIDVYYKKTSNLLNTVPVPAGSNFSNTLLVNVGNMTNQGIEFAIGANPVRTRNWRWNVAFNIAYNTNKITKLTAVNDPAYVGALQGNNVQINSVGYPADAFYVYHQEYNKATGKPIEGVYEDLNGDGIINSEDLYRYKTPFPPYILGFSTDLSYRRWTVSTVLRANIGNYMYNGLAANANEANVFNPLGYLANTLTNVLTTPFIYSNPQSDMYVQNASFLKMDNLALSFNAGHVFHNNANLRVSANCQNVFTITKYPGQDPELYGGVDNSFYPRPRTYSLGLNLQF